MGSYYNTVEGNLHPGDIAKSSDINHIQVHIQDALKNLINDLHDHESYIIGSGDSHKNDFVITPAKTTFGRYIDDMNIFEIDTANFININNFSVKQPLQITQTAVYSVIFKAKNSSNRDIDVTCDLEDINGNLIRRTTVVIPKKTYDPRDIEAVFDLDFYPTAPGLTHTMLKERDGKDIPLNTKEQNYDVGYVHEENATQFSIGVSKLFFVIHRTNLNEIDLADNGDEDVTFNPDEDLAVFYSKDVEFPEQKVYAEIKSGADWEIQKYNIHYAEVYSNGNTYSCTGGHAIINGEPIMCLDSFISVSGSNSYGNVISYVYLGSDGHLYSRNSKAADTTDLNKLEEDLEDRPPMAELLIAKILTYSSTKTNYNKEPLIIQTDEDQDTRPRSHHERIRRLEKKIKWISDIAVPSRIKYTLTNTSWIDEGGDEVAKLLGSGAQAEDGDNTEKSYVTTLDSKGNLVIRLTEAETQNILVTLKEKFTNDDGTKKTIQDTDVLNASMFGELKNVEHDEKNGILKLKVESAATTYGTTKKQAKETEFNPWDDDARNRVTKEEMKPTERKYTVNSESHDRKSQYPAMTFYTKTNYNLTKLQIPIRKFQNCSGIKFFIWKRQKTNNKTNTVWLPEKTVFTSKVFSLDKAKTKGKYQYMDKGFTIKFDKGGLNLEKGQYVIVCLPIPKSGKGSVFVETFKPKNSKDFCIRYEGDANATHFLLVDRYQEIWYNSATFTGTEQEYYKEGSAVSSVVNWPDAKIAIRYIKPILNGNLTTPKGSTAKIYGKTGGEWKELTPGENNEMDGGATSFQWKIEFTSKGQSTPELKYDEADQSAIEFVLIRDNLKGAGNIKEAYEADKNMCLTSKPIDGNNVLKQYLGDNSLDTNKDSRFSNFEFARVWASEEDNQNLLIDISASDTNGYYKREAGHGETVDTNLPYDIWSYHYCNLTLDDFSKINVDYSNYTEALEYDENNLRLKLDTEHSYNDDDIAVMRPSVFKKARNDIDVTEGNVLTLSSNSTLTENQTLLKASFDNYIDLTKYTGLRFRFKTTLGSTEKVIKGLGLYIGSEHETETPTTLSFLDKDVKILSDSDVLVPTIDPDVSVHPYYNGQIIEIVHLDKNSDQAPEETYYKYNQVYDEINEKYIYKLEQLHDFKSYNIYEFPNIVVSQKETESEETKTFDIRIEINPDSTNLKYVKEIGIISISEDRKDPDGNSLPTYEVINGPATLELTEIIGLKEDYYTIFDPEGDNGSLIESFKFDTHPYITSYVNKKHVFNTANRGDGSKPSVPTTEPPTTQLVTNTNLIEAKETILCYINHDYQGGLSRYKHIGIQIASDIYLPKDSIKINLCSGKDGGGEVVASVNLPTLNNIYYPVQDKAEDEPDPIILSQVFSKIDSDEKIKSISIVATKHFKNFINNILVERTTSNNTTTETKLRNAISLYLGKIVLYKAETIPIFHKKMRFKFYNTDKNGQITHQSEALSKDSIAIRKIGAVIDYK